LRDIHHLAFFRLDQRSTDRYGIQVNGYTGALIKNCTIGSGWRNGIRIKAATGVTVQTPRSLVTADSTAHVGYEIEKRKARQVSCSTP